MMHRDERWRESGLSDDFESIGCPPLRFFRDLIEDIDASSPVRSTVGLTKARKYLGRELVLEKIRGNG